MYHDTLLIMHLYDYHPFTNNITMCCCSCFKLLVAICLTIVSYLIMYHAGDCGIERDV